MRFGVISTMNLSFAVFVLALFYNNFKFFSLSYRYTNRVVTLWYRPPELLLGERNYGPPIDMWGAGCIMAEMWTRSPIMQGTGEQHQLTLISSLCGTINTEVWPGVDKYELFTKIELPQNQKRRVKERLKNHVVDLQALDLIDKLLTLDPSKRYDADTALNHDFFWSDPMPCDLTKTLSKLQTSMFELLTTPRRTQGGARIGGQPGASRAPNAPSQNINGAIYDRVF